MRQEDFEKILEESKITSKLSNSILEGNMDEVAKEFELTKNTIIELTFHLDKLEEVYDIFLKEHKKRTQ